MDERHWMIATVVLAMAASACGENLDLPAIRYRTEHLLIGTDFEEPACAGSLARLEGHVSELERRLGIDVDRQFELYWYADVPPCTIEHAAGCFDVDSEVILTNYTAARHEIGHAVSHLWGDPDHFYSEGVAEAFSGERSAFGSAMPSRSIGLSSGVPTHSAAHFIRWLYETRGADPLRVLFRNSVRRNPESARQAFVDAYGTSIAEMEQRFYAEAPEFYPGMTWCFDDVEVLPWDGGFWRHTIELDCAREHTDGAGTPSRTIAFDVERAGKYTFEIDAPGRAYITSCQTAVVGKGDRDLSEELPVGEEPGGEAFSIGIWITPGVPEELELGAGRYRVTVEVPEMERAEVRIHLGPRLVEPARD